jgi:hypothetical protein
VWFIHITLLVLTCTNHFFLKIELITPWILACKLVIVPS